MYELIFMWWTSLDDSPPMQTSGFLSNKMDWPGTSRLSVQAAKEGQAGVVALLVRKGANPNIRDQRGFTALDWAKKKKFTEVVRVLEAARQL
jgi:hypothetical protein